MNEFIGPVPGKDTKISLHRSNVVALDSSYILFFMSFGFTAGLAGFHNLQGLDLSDNEFSGTLEKKGRFLL